MGLEEVVFGPVPSRRLGISLGVNNVYRKYCTYSCIYCQAGRTTNLTVERRSFYSKELVIKSVAEALSRSRVKVRYVTFVPNGEPTLDINIGDEIKGLKNVVNCRVAVISNASLMWRRDVRDDLMNADLVSVKVDASVEEVFKLINRPHPTLRLSKVIEGLRLFSREYGGELITESMLVRGVNDSLDNVLGLADLIRIIEPSKSYIMIPVRPPAENWVSPPPREKVEEVIDELSRYLGKGRVELLAEVEGRPEELLGEDVIESIKRLTSVHPLKLDYALGEVMRKLGIGREDALRLLRSVKDLEIVRYGDEFFVRLKR